MQGSLRVATDVEVLGSIAMLACVCVYASSTDGVVERVAKRGFAIDESSFDNPLHSPIHR